MINLSMTDLSEHNRANDKVTHESKSEDEKHIDAHGVMHDNTHASGEDEVEAVVQEKHAHVLGKGVSILLTGT